MPTRTRRVRAPDRLVLTCEHAGNRIPREYASLFHGAKRLLDSHRGWDLGALAVARFLSRHFRQPLRSVMWSRLLVEPNRAPTNPHIWSRYTAGLSDADRARILKRYWWPHRCDVQKAIQTVVAGHRRAVHIAIHSFTPVLDGELRNADVGLLYDPRRAGEKALCTRWQKILKELNPKLCVRRNYPYPGVTDGFPTWLRRRFSERNYVGVELELNQALLTSPRRGHIQRLIAQSLGTLLR
ncbi:MAG TPA: N-formylglutamate amidohydrolase [Vicinamibacteria bacterium]